MKFAFIDSYIMIRMMSAYMEMAPSTVITFDLYSKLCGLSSKFKELFEKGKQENPVPAYAQTAAAPAQGQVAPGPTRTGTFCGQCGMKNEAGAKFCASCGAKM